MNVFINLYQQNPVGIFFVAVVFFVGYWLLRRLPTVYATALLTPAITWTCAAIWEWVVLRSSPEADIRIDLLVILPILVLVSLWGIGRAFLWRPTRHSN